MLAVLFLVFLLLFSICIAVTIGSVSISIQSVYDIILYQCFHIGNSANILHSPEFDIVWYIRLPRIILAVLVGIGLSISGVIMQAVVKNALADPYILGISSGASLGATLAIMLGIGALFGYNYVGVVAFIGAFIVSILVIAFSNINGRANATKLLLVGMSLSAMATAFSSFIIYTSKNQEGIKTISYWLLGSLAGAKWNMLGVIFGVIIITVIFFFTQYRTLNLMLLGDDVSITLGTDLHLYRIIYILVVSIIIGFVVYSSGTIGFVGLIIPHFTRILFGTNHKRLLIAAALIGGIFLIWADVFSRVIIPGSELPIGILISMIGAPVFIYLILSKAYGFGGHE